MQTSSLFPDDTTWSTKHEQKWTKESTEAFWKKNSFSEGLLCPLYSHWDSDNGELAGWPQKSDKLRHRRDN